MTPLRAVVLDFDGLVLDTESTWFAVWQSIFETHGQVYAIEDFHKIVGAESGVDDPRRVLEERTGQTLDWKVLDALVSADERRRNNSLVPLPGVLALIEAARQAGCGCAIASSSRHEWVDHHLHRLNLFNRFDAIVCRDDVRRAKPEPDLYLEALRRLNSTADQTLALEDSLNGTRAAKQAGIWCVAVPGPMTQTQDFSAADLVLPTLADVDLDNLWVRVRATRQSAQAHQ